MARILLESAKKFHHNVDLFICLADKIVQDSSFYPAFCEVVAASELKIPDFNEFAFRYDIMEFNTAVKPFMFCELLDRGYDAVLYFDPDIVIFSELTSVFSALENGASFVLTPHLCQPSEGDAYPGDVGIMKAGIYNLGFLAVGAQPEALSVLRWWSRRLQYQCINDQANGIFVDQRFMDLVPGFAGNARILRCTALNVAYWNLAQRRLDHGESGWSVDGQPLGFFHFSGFDPRHPTRLSKHTSAFRNDEMQGPILRLCEHYAAQLLANKHGSIPEALYAYGHFASGTRIPAVVRQMFRARHLTWLGGNPFDTYEEHLHFPLIGAAHSSSAYVVTNLMGYLRDLDVGLQIAFDITRPEGAAGYVRWYIEHAYDRLGDERLIEPVAVRAGKAAVPKRSPPSPSTETGPEVTIAGYLCAASGVGEAGRLTLRALHDNGVRCEGLDVNLHPAVNNEDSVSGLLVSQARGRYQIFHINADALPHVVNHLTPSLRSDAYRIVVPFWELARFPHAWLPAFDLVDEIWAPTKFIQRAILRAVPDKPVVHMPLALRGGHIEPLPRKQFGLPRDAFLFFFAFDYFSFIQRKNPLAALDAFKRAFRSADHHSKYGPVALVIKSLNAKGAPKQAQSLREALQNDPDVHLIESTLSRDETLGLMACTDAVLSLHRSEGLGLLIAEAIGLGKPVIATDYSASTELINPSTGYPVDFRLIPVLEGEYPFAQGQVWADPDIEHAAWQMQQVVAETTQRQDRIAAASVQLLRNHSVSSVGVRHAKRLNEIERQSVRSR